MNKTLLAVVTLAAAAAPASAQFSNPHTPAFRGASCTEYSGWDVFTSAFGGANTPDAPASGDDAVIVQLTAGAILTSTSNFYHPGGNLSLELTDTVPEDLQEVVLQVSTLGNTRDYASFMLNYTGSGGPVSVPADSFFFQVQAAGAEEIVFTWDLSGNADDITDFTLTWDAAAPHMSLTAVLLDTRYDCASAEPGTASCFGVGCPCGNDDAAAGCANSTGSGALLAGSGTTSVTADDLVLTATGIPNNQQGLFYMGNSVVSNQLYDGFQCALGSTFRFLNSVQSSGATGTMTYTGFAADAPAQIVSGSTWNFHVWHRDVPGTPCGTGANFSNLYSVTFTP